jgi:PAS domain S-box-containing protein
MVEWVDAGGLQSEENLALLLDNTADAIVKSRDGVIVWCNDRVLDIFGYRKEDLLGTDGSVLFPRVTEYSDHREMAHQATEESGNYRGRTEVAKKDGSPAFVEFSISRIPDKEPPEFVIIAGDITRRVFAQRALRESEDRYRLLAENATDVVWTMDMDLRYTYISPSIERQRGYSPEEFLALDRGTAFTMSTLQAGVDALIEQLALEGTEGADPARSWTVVMEAYCKDGSTSWVESTMAFLRDEDGKATGILGAARDITKRVLAEQALQQAKDGLEAQVKERTAQLAEANRELRAEIDERKRAEDELRRSEERFRALIESSSDGITVLDAEGRMKYQSPSVARITGYEPDGGVGKTSFDLVYPDDMPKVIEGLNRLRRRPGETEHVEVRILHADGTWHTLDVVARNLLDDPAVGGIVVNQRDITEKKRDEEELASLQAALNASVDGVVIIDAEGNVKDVNESVLRKHGYPSKSEMIGRKALDFIAPEDWEKVSSSVEQMDRDGYIENSEYCILTKDGIRVPVEGNGVVLRDRDGRLLGYVVVARDITERKEALEALRTSEERLRALIENSSDGITLLDSKGMLKYESPSVPRITGYEPGEWSGRDTFEVVHPDDVQAVSDAFRRLWGNPGGTERLEMRFLHKDGTWRTLEVAAKNLLDNPAVEGVVVNKRDVTERRQAEEALRSSEAHYRLLAENLTDVIWTMDLDLRYTYLSPSVTRGLGYTVEEAMARTVVDTMTPASLERAMGVLAEEMSLEETGQADPLRSRTLEVELYRKDGSTLWAELTMTFLRDPDGRATGILGVARDTTQRRRDEEAVLEAEKRYQAIFDNRLVMVFVNDEEGRFLDANDAALERLGYAREDLGRLTFQDIVHPEDLTRVLYVMAEGREKGYMALSLELRLVTASGETIWVEVLGLSLELQGQRYVSLGMALDITERKQSEEQLRASEEKLRLYLDSSPDAIYISDSTATFSYGNRAAERIIGYSREELIGKSFLELDLLPPEQVSKAAWLLSLNIAGQPTGPDEFELIRKDGSRISVEISTYPIGDGDNLEVIGIARDATERKRIEAALRDSEENLRALIENAPDAITAYDLEGTILDCNRRGEELLGYSREELVGRGMFEIGVIPEDYTARAGRALEKGDWDMSGRPFEFDLLTKDGSRITVEATTITVERGGQNQIICISRDVTERRQMEQQLQLAGRLAAVGELAAGVAHELNNPLSAVQGFAQYLAERESVDANTRGDLETIYREAQRATRITGNLLSFARKHAPEKTFLSLNDVVERSLELHAYRMRVNNVAISTELASDLPKTMADFHQMQQVFVNVITNAEQAMTQEHGRGTLTIKTEQAGKMIRVTFGDNGPGMSREVLSSVFDPFFTTKEVGKGTGLGLSICYGIVREHGGRLHAESDPGRGATFVVEIPIVPEEAPADTGADDSVRERPVQQK